MSIDFDSSSRCDAPSPTGTHANILNAALETVVCVSDSVTIAETIIYERRGSANSPRTNTDSRRGRYRLLRSGLLRSMTSFPGASF